MVHGLYQCRKFQKSGIREKKCFEIKNIMETVKIKSFHVWNNYNHKYVFMFFENDETKLLFTFILLNGKITFPNKPYICSYMDKL